MASENPDGTLSLEEIANLPRVEFSAEVEERWARFTELYNEHRFVIENRWMKMRKQLRMQLLTKHWRSSGGTEMPSQHAPDLTGLAPWRDESGDKDRTIVPPRQVNHSHLRWPTFNLTDLSDPPHSFLQLLLSRSYDHPKRFATDDCFFENNESAGVSLGFLETVADRHRLVIIPNGGLRITSGVLNSDQGDSIYGAIEIVDDLDDLQMMWESNFWNEEEAQALMVIQRRIYHFLEDVVRDIMAEDNEAKYKVVQEQDQTIWQPQLPDSADSEDEYNRKRNEYIDLYRTMVPYKAANADMWDFATQIVRRRIEFYEIGLANLKESPGLFLENLIDMRQHSHHVVSRSNGRIHPFANLNDNQNNGNMWGIYLLRALHNWTEGLDIWRCILSAMDSYRNVKLEAAESDDTEEDNPLASGVLGWLFLYYVTLYNLVRPQVLRDTLACSQQIRNYFTNTSDDDEKPVLQGNGAFPTNNNKVASLVSLLRTMSEPKMDLLLPLKSETLANEILNLLLGQNRGTWMSNFGLAKAQENHDAATLWLLLRRYWRHHGLNPDLPLEMMDNPAEGSVTFWREQLVPSDKLLGLNLNLIVAKHITPYPEWRFEYPSIKAGVKPTKRKELAGKRRNAEARLKALWADLQPLLEEKQAISEYAAKILNNAIPKATGEDGEDVTPEDIPDPPAPSTPPQGPPGPEGPGSPHTPPAATVTPTQQLGGLGINSPANRPPPLRTPEKKTANDGVKKISPIRPARPGEDGPRRPKIDRRTRELDRQRAREEQRRARARSPPRAAVVPPQAAPPPAVEYPKIPLSAQSYDIIRRVYVTSGEKNPSGIPWEHIKAIFAEIGFDLSKRGSRGGLHVWTPNAELARTQGINTIISRDRPHDPRLSFIKTREFLRGNFGFGKYGWDFNKFTER